MAPLAVYWVKTFDSYLFIKNEGKNILIIDISDIRKGRVIYLGIIKTQSDNYNLSFTGKRLLIMSKEKNTIEEWDLEHLFFLESKRKYISLYNKTIDNFCFDFQNNLHFI